MRPNACCIRFVPWPALSNRPDGPDQESGDCRMRAAKRVNRRRVRSAAGRAGDAIAIAWGLAEGLVFFSSGHVLLTHRTPARAAAACRAGDPRIAARGPDSSYATRDAEAARSLVNAVPFVDQSMLARVEADYQRPSLAARGGHCRAFRTRSMPWSERTLRCCRSCSSACRHAPMAAHHPAQFTVLGLLLRGGRAGRNFGAPSGTWRTGLSSTRCTGPRNRNTRAIAGDH